MSKSAKNEKGNKAVSLSKSRLARGFQCDKQLYFTIFRPELEPKTDATTQSRFDQGNKVGELARKQFPKGMLIDAKPWETAKGVALTSKAIESGLNTIFEATFQFKNFSVRADILHRKDNLSRWHFTEVKSSTKAKPEQITDVTIQAWVLKKAGIQIGSYSLMLINNQCIAPNFEDLFYTEDITEEVNSLFEEVEKKILSLATMIESEKEPQREIGHHCNDPYGCPFQGVCWKHVPSPSIFDIPKLGAVAWDLYAEGKLSPKDLKVSDFDGVTKTAIKSHQTGKRSVDSNGIKNAVKDWTWPIYFLDFETINPAIPLYDNTRPYQQVPFQFSCHKLEKNETLSHSEYLHVEKSDPRRQLVEAMLGAIGNTGSIVAYNKSFEAGVIESLASIYPKHKKRLQDIVERLVDPLPIFQSFVYDPQFLATFSLKAVAPAILGQEYNYDDLEIGDGTTTQLAFLELVFGTADANQKKTIRESMLTYCRQDTMATVELVKWLFNDGVSINE